MTKKVLQWSQASQKPDFLWNLPWKCILAKSPIDIQTKLIMYHENMQITLPMNQLNGLYIQELQASQPSNRWRYWTSQVIST